MLYSIVICIAYIIGIIWGLYLDLYLGIVFIFLFICLFLLFIRNISEVKKTILLVIICFIIGILNTNYRTDKFQNKYSSGVFYGNGEIIKLIDNGEYYNKYVFKNDVGDKFLLYINNTFELQANTIISFKGLLELPKTKRNRGRF